MGGGSGGSDIGAGGCSAVEAPPAMRTIQTNFQRTAPFFIILLFDPVSPPAILVVASAKGIQSFTCMLSFLFTTRPLHFKNLNQINAGVVILIKNIHHEA